jgi:hypothetical protein
MIDGSNRPMLRNTSDPLEAWVDKSILECQAKGYHPGYFIDMRRRLGTVPAMEQLVETGDIQSGFRRLKSDSDRASANRGI